MENLKCNKCSYSWSPRLPDPKECPRCKSRYWATPRKYATKGARHEDTARSNNEVPQGYAELISRYKERWSWKVDLTFLGYPSRDTALKIFRRFIHILNRECFGKWYFKDEEEGVIWVLGVEYQDRGAIHFHSLIGDIPEPVVRKTDEYEKIWSGRVCANICSRAKKYAAEIRLYKKDDGGELYVAKGTHPYSIGEVEFSRNLVGSEDSQ